MTMNRSNKGGIPPEQVGAYVSEYVMVKEKLHSQEARTIVETLFPPTVRSVEIMEKVIQHYFTTTSSCRLCAGHKRWWVIYDVLKAHSLLSSATTQQLFITAIKDLGLWKGARYDFRPINPYFRRTLYTEWGKEIGNCGIRIEKVMSYYQMAMMVRNTFVVGVDGSHDRLQCREEYVKLSDDNEPIFVDCTIRDIRKIK